LFQLSYVKIKRKSDEISSPVPQYTSINIPLILLYHTYTHLQRKINEHICQHTHANVQETAPPHPWRYSAIPRKVDGSSVIRDWGRHLKLSQENDGSNVWQQTRHILFTEVTYNYASVTIFSFHTHLSLSLSHTHTLPFSLNVLDQSILYYHNTHTYRLIRLFMLDI
jgi:hypothetical protein